MQLLVAAPSSVSVSAPWPAVNLIAVVAHGSHLIIDIICVENVQHKKRAPAAAVPRRLLIGFILLLCCLLLSSGAVSLLPLVTFDVCGW